MTIVVKSDTYLLVELGLKKLFTARRQYSTYSTYAREIVFRNVEKKCD